MTRAAAAERLDRRALNRALLARQHLLDRFAGPLPEAVESAGALQAQHWPAIPVALWSRVRDLRLDALYAALDARELLMGTLIRGTLHVVSAREHPAYAAVADAAGADGWSRAGAGAVRGPGRARGGRRPPARPARARSLRRGVGRAAGARRGRRVARPHAGIPLAAVPHRERVRQGSGGWRLDGPRARDQPGRPLRPARLAAAAGGGGARDRRPPAPARVRPGGGRGRGVLDRPADAAGARGAAPPGARPRAPPGRGGPAAVRPP